jgi:hypothetical protein
MYGEELSGRICNLRVSCQERTPDQRQAQCNDYGREHMVANVHSHANRAVGFVLRISRKVAVNNSSRSKTHDREGHENYKRSSGQPVVHYAGTLPHDAGSVKESMVSDLATESNGARRSA